MAWIMLIIAGFFEVSFATCLTKMKDATGTPYFLWLGGFLVSLFIGMYLLYRATQTIPMGTAYAVWTGIGAVGTVLVGILIFNEPADIKRVFFLTTLILSIVGLKAVSH